MTPNEMTAYQSMTSFDQQQIDMLHQPLEARFIEHRPGGGGKQLAYISAKTAIDTAKRVFGFGKWGYRVVSRSFEKSTNPDGTCTGFFYTADVELYVIGCPFPFPGEGIGVVTPLKSGAITPDCHEKARKEAVTDAMKRALRHYGDQFGLALYDEDSYVDAGDGVMVQVKDVKPGHVLAKPRTIEAGQPTKQIAPVPTDLAARLKSVTARAASLGVARDNTEWSAMLRYLEISKVRSAVEIDLIDGYLSGVEAQKAEAVTP